LLSNDSLKLSIINEYSNVYNAAGQTESTDGLVLIATFRCFASDSFGTIVSRPANVYQIKNGKQKILFEKCVKRFSKAYSFFKP